MSGMSNSKKSKVPFLLKVINAGACYRIPEEKPFVASNTFVQMVSSAVLHGAHFASAAQGLRTQRESLSKETQWALSGHSQMTLATMRRTQEACG